MYTMYDKSGHGQMSFDLFVQSCIVLKRMTDVFKRYDDDRDGYITLSFEEFLTGRLATSFVGMRSCASADPLTLLQKYCANDEQL